MSALSRRSFSRMASFSAGVPPTGVYFVFPCASASRAAAFTCSGVSKSGSPAERSTMSRPSAISAAASAAMLSVGDGLMPRTRAVSFIARPGGCAPASRRRGRT